MLKLDLNNKIIKDSIDFHKKQLKNLEIGLQKNLSKLPEDQKIFYTKAFEKIKKGEMTAEELTNSMKQWQ